MVVSDKGHLFSKHALHFGYHLIDLLSLILVRVVEARDRFNGVGESRMILLKKACFRPFNFMDFPSRKKGSLVRLV